MDNDIDMYTVREYPCLYDTSRKSYKNRKTTKANALAEIGAKFDSTKEEVENRFVSLALIDYCSLVS